MAASRRAFLQGVAVLGASGTLLRPAGASIDAADPAPAPSEFPRQDADSVRDTVGASHRDLDKVKGLVGERPALAKAAWDWGFGDWETALGAASHVGRRDIAEYLIEQGARIDIFAAAMLGQTEVVRAFIEASPGIQRTPGPHGIPLLAHARAGGTQAAAVVALLEKVGDAGIVQRSADLTEEQFRMCLGTYVFGTGAGERFVIKDVKGALQLVTGEGAGRALFHLGNLEFHPTGARAVRIAFEAGAGGATRVTVRDGGVVVVAARADL